MLSLEENEMSNFIKINNQRVKHTSGYEIFSAGRLFYGYQYGSDDYRIFTENGWNPKLNENYIYIYISDIYDRFEKKINISNEHKNGIIEKVILGVRQMTTFTIITVDETGKETVLS